MVTIENKSVFVLPRKARAAGDGNRWLRYHRLVKQMRWFGYGGFPEGRGYRETQLPALASLMCIIRRPCLLRMNRRKFIELLVITVGNPIAVLLASTSIDHQGVAVN